MLDGSGGPRAQRGKVYVVDDDDSLRTATCINLAAEGYEAAGFDSGPAFLKTVEPTAGGCLVLDMNMPEMSGLEVQRRLRERDSNIAVVFVTGYGDVPTAVTAVRAGAVDFIEKPYRPEVLLSAIDRALAVEVPTSGKAAAVAAKAAIDALTRREADVLRGLVAGRSNKDMAADLGLSPRTVEMHRANMMERLGVSSLPEALRIAYDAGFARDRRRTSNLPRVGGRRATDGRDG